MVDEQDEEELEDESEQKVRSFTTVVKPDTNINTAEAEPTDDEEEIDDEGDDEEEEIVTEDTAKGIDKTKTKVKAVKKDEKVDDETIQRYAPKLAETIQSIQGGQMVSSTDMQAILKTSPNALKLMRKVADTHAYNMETYGSASKIEINKKIYKRQHISTKVWREAKKIDASSELITDPVERMDAEIDTFNKRAKLYWGIPEEVSEQMSFTYLKTLVVAVEYSILNGFR